MRWLICTLAAAGVFASTASAAENVTRKRDKPLSGDVTDVSKTEVTIKVKNPREETLRIPAIDVLNISWTGEPPEANLARNDDTGGRYQRAIDGYQKSLQTSKAPNPLSKVELEYGITRATAKLALTDPSRIDEALKRLEEFRSKYGDHYRFYEAVGLLGQLHFAKKDFAKAQSAFDTLAKAPWKESQLASKIFTGRMLQADNKADEALAAFDEVIGQSADGKVEEAQKQEAILGKAQVLLAQKKYDEAQKLLAQIKDDANDPRVMAEAYVRLGDCLREQGKDSDAIFAYLHVEVLFASEKPLRAEALFHLTRLFEKTGQKAKAAELRDVLESDELKNTEWARQLKSPAAG